MLLIAFQVEICTVLFNKLNLTVYEELIHYALQTEHYLLFEVTK